jgi:hypothetical protein
MRRGWKWGGSLAARCLHHADPLRPGPQGPRRDGSGTPLFKGIGLRRARDLLGYVWSTRSVSIISGACRGGSTTSSPGDGDAGPARR